MSRHLLSSGSRRYFPLLLALSLLLTDCGGNDSANAVDQPAGPPPAKQQNIPAYATQQIRIQEVDQPIQVIGRVVPLQEVQISSQVPGKVLPTNKLLQEGKYYGRGETMIRIDDEQLLYTLQAERSQLVTNLVRLLSDLSFDYPQEHPTWEAFTNSIRADQVLPALPEIENDQLRYFISANGIPAQYYGIKAREATLDDYTIIAPFSGKLTSANVDPGTIVQPGQPLATLSRTDIYEVRASIPVAAVEQVKIGQTIELYARNLDRTYRGTVNRFGTAIDEGTQTVIAYVRLSGKELRTGLYLEAELPGQKLANVAVLPKEALSRDGKVFLIQDGTVRMQEVEVALVEADKVYLRGLQAGDRVITESVSSTIAGTKAR